jgi:methylmalonyl-CoA mutase N-terminal domain/subunit
MSSRAQNTGSTAATEAPGGTEAVAASATTPLTVGGVQAPGPRSHAEVGPAALAGASELVPPGTPLPRTITSSGIAVAPVYGPADVSDLDYARDLGDPGRYPFTRGPYSTMYRGRLWTMRQYAGYGTAQETNRRFRFLLERGQTGLSVAFDLPTQMGLDSDHQRADGEVGRVGVAIDSIADMRELLDGIPLDRVSTSMTINATAPILLALYYLVGEEQGHPESTLRGTVQNDILKEYIARGTYIYPPQFSLRLATDLIAHCTRHRLPWNPISISGYHIREAGASAAQELAFTFANAMCYCDSARAAGLEVDEFAPRLSFFFGAHIHLFEEVAKFRAARRMWARIMRERFGAKRDESMRLRFHTQTDGVTLTAQQPLNNAVRVTVQALAAVLGGTQSLHTNAYDEALGLPTPDSAELALRTQQILAWESGVPNTGDPLGGSYYIESLTSELERKAEEIMARIAELGGAVAALEGGFFAGELSEQAYAHQRRLESGDEVIVGVNRFCTPGDEQEPVPRALTALPELEARQRERLARHRTRRDTVAVERQLRELAEAARTLEAPLFPHIKEACRAGATVGEISDVFRGVAGEYDAA